MLYIVCLAITIIIVIIIFIALFIFTLYLLNKDTSVVDGKIIRVDKVRDYQHRPSGITHFKITIIYSYIVNNKKYVSSATDYFGMSNFFYKYIKTKENRKIFRDVYIYYVKKEDIKVRYKIHNPQEAVINNFILKQIIYLFGSTTICGLIALMLFFLMLYIYY